MGAGTLVLNGTAADAAATERAAREAEAAIDAALRSLRGRRSGKEEASAADAAGPAEAELRWRDFRRSNPCRYAARPPRTPVEDFTPLDWGG